MTASATVWCELALIDGEVRPGVTIEFADGRFTRVAPATAPASGVQRLDGVTIPGLANAHSHAFHRALRARTHDDGGTFWTWRDLMYRAAERLDPDSYHALARATFAEMVMAGITVVGEFHYVHHQQDGSRYQRPNAMGEAVLAAANEAGLRITLLDTLYLHGGLHGGDYLPLTERQRRFGDGSVDRWGERVDALATTDTQRVGAAIHSVRAVDPESIAAVASWATARRAVVHAHVSEQPAENEQVVAAFGATPTGVLGDHGVLGPTFTAVHATHLTDADVELLAGSTVCMCPTTERDLGDGIGPSVQLVDAGAALSLGSDSHAVIDLFEEARAVELDERLRAHDRGAHRADALLAAATIAGHRCLGWHDAGEIAVGRRADLVTVSLESVRTAGISATHGLEAVVFAATASDVSHVVVDGRPVVSDGRHLDIDVPVELSEAITTLMQD